MRLPRWTPCFVDPDEFSCSDCEVPKPLACPLLLDETRRDFEAARWRRRRGGTGSIDDAPDDDISVLVELQETLRQQRVSVPAELAHKFLPQEARNRLTPAGIKMALRSSEHFRETTPGMFVAVETEGNEAPKHDALPVRSGVAIEALLAIAAPNDATQQLAAFKELSGLRRLASFAESSEIRLALEGVVGELLPSVQARDGLTLTQIHAAATSGIATSFANMSEEAKDCRHSLFSAIQALQLLDHDDLREPGNRLVAVRDKLVLANLRLVATIVDSLRRGAFVRWADSFQAGVMGLLAAIDRFDPFMGFAFSTYATHWIRQAATRQLADSDRAIRLPIHVVDELNRVLRSKRQIETGQNGGALSTEIAEHLKADGSDIDPEHVDKLLALNRSVFSWDAMLDAGVDRATNHHVDAETKSDLRAHLDELLTLLSADQRQILQARFGWHGEPEALEIVGRRQGVTRERIRQKEARALRLLRANGTLIERYLEGSVDLDSVEERFRRDMPRRKTKRKSGGNREGNRA